MSSSRVGDKTSAATSYNGHPSDMGRSFDHNGEKPQSCREAMCGKRTRRYMFFFIIAVLAILTLKDVLLLMLEYFESPKTTDMNIRFNKSMTMPNVTFCMSKDQAWSHFTFNASESNTVWDQSINDAFSNITDKDAALHAPWDYPMVMESYDLIASISSLERETTAHGTVRSIYIWKNSPRLAGKRKLLKKWMDFLESRNITYPELVQKVGVETLRRSIQIFQRMTYDEDLVIKTSMRITWISQMEICFKPEFDAENYHPIKDQGLFFKMVLSHNADNLEGKQLECMTADMHGRPSSIARFIEGNVAKNGIIEELCAGMRHEARVEVQAHYKFLENKEDGTECKEMEDDDDTFIDCKLRCRLEMLKEICNCVPLSLAYLEKEEDGKKMKLCDYTECVLDKERVQRNNFTDEPCRDKCRRSCDQTRFRTSHETKGRMIRSDLTLIELHWGSFEYTTLEQDWKYSVTEILSQLGGSIGMYLGLSILSLIQGGTYLYSYLKKNVVQEKILKKQSTFDSRGRRMSKASDVGSESAVDFPSKTKYSFAANPLENPWHKKKPKSFDSQRSFDHEDNVGQVNTNPNPTRINVD